MSQVPPRRLLQAGMFQQAAAAQPAPAGADPEARAFAMHSRMCAGCSTPRMTPDGPVPMYCSQWLRQRAMFRSRLYKLCSSSPRQAEGAAPRRMAAEWVGPIDEAEEDVIGLNLETLIALLDESSPEEASFQNGVGETPLHALVSNTTCPDHLECVRAFLERFPDVAFIGKTLEASPFLRSCSPHRRQVGCVFLSHFESFLAQEDSEDEQQQNERRAAVLQTVRHFISEGPTDMIELYTRIFGAERVREGLGNPFEELFRMRNEHQLRIFPFFVVFFHDLDVVKSLLTPEVLVRFFGQAQDEYRHAELFEKIYSIVGSDLFDMEFDGNVLHWISRSWNYGNQKLFEALLEKMDDETLRRLLKVSGNTVIHTMMASGSVNHYDDERGLTNLRRLLKRAPEALRETNFEGRNPVQCLCFSAKNIPKRDSYKVLRTFKIFLEEGPEGIASTLTSEMEVPLREAGHHGAVTYLMENGADFSPTLAFFDLEKQYEVNISGGGTIAEPQYDYGLALSYDEWRTGKHSCLFRVEALRRADGAFFGVARKDIPMNIYLGNRDGAAAIRTNGTKHQAGDESKGFSSAILLGSKVEMVLDCDASTLSFVVDGKALENPSDGSPVVVTDLPSGDLCFGFGLFRGSGIRVLVEWTIHSHLTYRKSFRDLIKLLLLIHGRETSALCLLPKDVLLYGVFGFINSVWWD